MGTSLLPESYPGGMRAYRVEYEGAPTEWEGVVFGDGRVITHAPHKYIGHRTLETALAEFAVNDWRPLWSDEEAAGGPRLFVMIRDEDISGFSGVGVAMEGAQFSDGTVFLRWLGEYSSLVTWPSVEQAVTVHGHGGATALIWLDGEGALAAP